jgi:AsmA-like C-terminal region
VNDSTIVKCRGEATPGNGGFTADLTIDAADVPLDDTLKLSLPAAGQLAWDELRPQGRIDFSARARKQPDRVEPDVEVVLRPRGKTVSVEPRMFPYRLEQVDGQATYQRGRVDLQKVVGQHDRTVYAADAGVWQIAPDGGWQLGFSNVSADRLSFGRDLLAALPPALQTTLDRLQPVGTFGLYKSNLNFVKSPYSPSFSAEWDISLECQQASIQGALPLRGIDGDIRLVGRSDGRTAVSSGEMAIDSVVCKDTQLTNLHGPIWIDSSRLLLGEPACRQQNQTPRRVTADAYGGSLNANIELLHDLNPSYKLDLHLGGANLSRFVTERLGGPNDMGGTVSGTLVLMGTGQTMQTLSGSGVMHVVDGHIYQIPLLVSLLSVLKNKTPDTTAFNRCDMKFTIQGENIHFENLNLLGDAVSLYGSGDAKLNRTLDLVFYTLIGPADLPIPLWKTIAGHVSQQSWQLKVVGTMDNPKIERKALPAVNDMLDHIQSELQEGAATMSPATTARPRVLAR